MPRGSLRSFATAVLWSAAFGVLAALLLFIGARFVRAADGPVHEAGWTQRSRALFDASGFYGAELDQTSGRHFSWSRESATLTFAELNRTRAHRVTLRIGSGRPPGITAPRLNISVDGRPRATELVPGGDQSIVFEIPRRQGRGAVVTLDVSPVYKPGGPDPRALGIIVDAVRVEPVNGSFVPSIRVLLLLALSVTLVALAIRVAGLEGGFFVSVTAASAVAFVWLLLADAAFAGSYIDRIVHIATGALVAGSVVALVGRRWPTLGGAEHWPIAAAILIALTAIKVAIFWHPLIVVGDGMFQVHRAQVVHGGQYFFTSVTPKPFFEFPYPVALYVAAQPFWSLFPTELDLLRLLRCIAIVADGIVGLALYGAVRRLWSHRSAALWCAVLWPFARAPLEALCNANLTNLFGQSAFGAGVAGIAWLAASGRLSIAGALATVLFIVVGFLSHFGTVTVGVGVLLTIAAVLLVLGRDAVRRTGLLVAGITLAAAIVSWVAYYSHDQFIDVYKNTWTSVSTQQADDSSKVVATPAVKLQRWWSGTGDDYGRPGLAMLLAAFAGAAVLFRRFPRHGASLVILGWLLAWIGMTALGILTPFTLRANLAAAPALIALCGIALGAAQSRSRLLTLAIAAVILWDGWQIAARCLDLAGPG